MTREELKALVKQHFNLTEVVEKFDSAQLEDGSIVSNQEEGKFEIGQILYIKDEEGNFVPAPEGEHVSDSGIQFILDKDSKIVGLKYPDAAGEGEADLAVEEQPVAEITKGEGAEEGAFEKEEDLEEEAKEEELEEEKREDISMEEVIKVIGEVVEAKVEELKKKMAEHEEKMEVIEEKLSAFSNEPAESKTLPNVKFSSEDFEFKNASRYNKMLAKLSKNK